MLKANEPAQTVKSKKSQSGFSVIEVLLILVIIGALVGIGMFVWRSRAKPNAALQNDSVPVSKEELEPKIENKIVRTTESFLLKYEMEYPATWKVITEDSTQGDGGPKTHNETLTSPGGTRISISQDYGGRGGHCEPDASDQFFKAGNSCPSFEVVSLESLKNTVRDETGKTIPLLLTLNHFADTDGKQQYNICLQASTSTKYPVEAKKPVMGFLTSTPHITTYNADGSLGNPQSQPERPFYLTACAKGTSPEFFNSPDGKAVQQILRTFRFTD